MNPLRSWTVKLPVYNAWFVVLAGGAADSAHRRFDRLAGEPSPPIRFPEYCEGACFYGPARVFGIWVKDPGRRPDSAGMGFLAHEAAHAAAYVLERSGAEMTPEVMGEPFCYLLGFIVEQSARRLWFTPRPRRKAIPANKNK